MKKIFIPNIGDLSDIQHTSYYKFLLKGLEFELKSLQKAYLNVDFLKENIFYKIYFLAKNVKFIFPENNFLESNIDDETYSIHTYLPIFYSCKEINNILNFFLDKKNENINIINNIIENQKTYNITPYFKYDKKSIKEKLKTIYCCGDVYLCEIPLMTQEGTFLITGCERVVISQIIRAPGIYFRRELNPLKGITLCTATIISDKGLWTKFSLMPETKNLLKFYINSSDFLEESSSFNEFENNLEDLENEKIDIFLFFKYFDISFNELSSCLSKSQLKILFKFFEKNKNITNFEFNKIKKKIHKYFYSKDIGCFSIGENGRRNINYKFYYNIPKYINYINGLDLIFIFKNIINLKYFGLFADDIDHIKNKQIRPIGSILQNQFRIGYLTALNELSLNLEKKEPFQIKEKKEDPSIDNILYSNTKKIWEIFLEFFKTSEISQYMDQTNSLSEIIHKRRISIFGPNGLKRDNVSLAIRDIHPSQYAKLCPIETPEGDTAGLLSSLSLFSRFNTLGYIETPYFSLEKGKINLFKPAIYLDSELEKFKDIGFCDTSLDLKSSKIIKANIPIKEDTFFSIFKKENISFLTLSPIQLLSLSTNLVPFIEHNDANRGLMGANMQRQALPLLYCQKAIVGTGFESNIILESSMILTSYTEGEVFYVNSEFIIIKDLFNQKLKYNLKKFYNSNQETCINQQSCVWPGEHIFSNQIIADGGGTLDGEFAIGKNLTIAYMPWDGYNFEDAIIINEKLIYNNLLTSINIEEYETFLNSNFFNSSFIQYENKKNNLFYYIQNLEYIPKDIIIQILKIINSKSFDKLKKNNFEEKFFNDILLKLKKNKKLNFKSKILNKFILYFLKNIKKWRKLNINSNNILNIKDKKIDYNTNQTINKVEDEKNILNDEIYLATFHLLDYEKRNLDHNGIIKKGSYIFPKEVLVAKVKRRTREESNKLRLIKLMNNHLENENYADASFRLPKDTEGRVLDVRIFSEKNFINLNESLEDSDSFYIKYEKLKFIIAQIRKIEVGDKLAGRHGNKGVISKILSEEDMPYLPDGTPVDIIFNPLGVPSRMNVGQIFESLLGFAGFYLGKRFKVTPFDEIYGEEASRILVNQKLKEAKLKSNKNWIYSLTSPGKILLKDGRTGEYFDNPIFIGKSYIIKLMHLVNDKLHGRAVGPYSLIIEQPLTGKAFDGGQRFGEMETWALEGFGCSMILNELFTVKSDDINARNEFYESIVCDNFFIKPNITIGETFLTLIRELNSLGLNFIIKKVEFNLKKFNDIKLIEKNFFQDIEKRLELKAFIKKKNIKTLDKKLKIKKENLTKFSKNFLNKFLQY